MVIAEFTFLSADKKTPIHAVEWTPEDGPVRAVLQISHGVAEYALRYAPFAEFLTARGFAVVSHDHIGHGLSVARGAPRLYFGPKGSWRWVVDDLYARRELTGKRFPGVPRFLLGHSMGSFLARTYLIRYPGTVDGAVLMGTGHMSGAMVSGGRAVAAAEALRLGDRAVSPVVDRLAFGAYNRIFAPNRTAFDWLSVSEENVDAYLADPLCGGNASVGLFREMLSGIAYIKRPENLRRMNLNTPILFVSGSMDPVGECGKGVERACAGFQRAGVRDVSMKLYENARHEILNDTCRETVYQDILRWLEAHL